MAQGVAALVVAAMLVMRGLAGADQRVVNGLGTAVWFVLVGGGVLAARMGPGDRQALGPRAGRVHPAAAAAGGLVPGGGIAPAGVRDSPSGCVALIALGLLFSPSAVRWAAGGDQRGSGQRGQFGPDTPVGSPLALRLPADAVVQRDGIGVPVQHRPRQPRVARCRRIRRPASPAARGPARGGETAAARTGLPGRCPPRRPRWRS